MKDRLIELLRAEIPTECDKHENCIGCPYEFDEESCIASLAAATADHLLANGVIVPPVKLGQTVYYIVIFMGKPEIFEGKVNRFNIDDYAIWADVGFTDGVSLFEISKEIGKRIFLTREEAERALKEREWNDN